MSVEVSGQQNSLEEYEARIPKPRELPVSIGISILPIIGSTTNSSAALRNIENVKTMRGSGRELTVPNFESDFESALKSARRLSGASEEIIGLPELYLSSGSNSGESNYFSHVRIQPEQRMPPSDLAKSNFQHIQAPRLSFAMQQTHSLQPRGMNPRTPLPYGTVNEPPFSTLTMVPFSPRGCSDAAVDCSTLANQITRPPEGGPERNPLKPVRLGTVRLVDPLR